MYCKVVFDVPLDRDFDYAVPEELASLVMPGVRVTAPFGRMLTTGLVVSISQQTTLQNHILIKKIACVLDEKPLFGSDLFPLAQFMKQTWGGAIGQILFALIPPQAYFKLLPDQTQNLTLNMPVFAPLSGPAAEALTQLQDKLQNGYQPILLSGTNRQTQTDIIVRLAAQVWQNFGQVLLTVPDVLAAQHFTLYLQKLFGTENVYCWHSKMLLSQKKIIFSRISNGLPGIVVSVRSGGLLPFKNLRIAAILEADHDNYKQEENKPYFHLRDLMAFRCKQHEAMLIYASETPSLELLHSVQQKHLEPVYVAEKQPNLTIRITEKKGSKSALISDPLLHALQQNLEQKQAALFILNRRGYANTYYCFNCGAYAKCKECGSILSREKTEQDGDYLICKKCGHKESLDQTCPKCQNKIFKSRGGGTQKIVTEINKLFPSARVLRLDSDTLKNKDGQGYQIRQAVEQGKADIVVGTRQALEMAHCKRITLAAIMDADLELDGPDFRASEKFGQLLFKLKNKLAGRTQSALFVQASSSDIYPFENLQIDYQTAAEEELLARKSFNYPPFIKLVKVLVKGKDPVLIEAEIARIMSAAAPFSTEVLGPVKTGKKTDKTRKQYILFKTNAEKYTYLVKTLDQLKPSKKTEFKLLADPYDFY